MCIYLYDYFNHCFIFFFFSFFFFTIHCIFNKLFPGFLSLLFLGTRLQFRFYIIEDIKYGNRNHANAIEAEPDER